MIDAKKIIRRKEQEKGSRPPPTKRPSTSSLSILFVMGLIVVGAFVASGNAVPVDPNGPDGPPTLGPYYNPADYPIQHIVTPTGQQQTGTKENLQLHTFQVDNCGQNSVTLFVIDTSGSMSYANKIGHEKQALTYFTNNMGGLSVIGIDTFGQIVQTQTPFNYYKYIKTQVKQVISKLTPLGGTPTRDALQLAYDQISQAIKEQTYPGYTYNLVLITDGVPEKLPPRTCEPGTTITDPNDNPDRCFAQEEDPRVPTNIPDKIRSLGADIYSINVYSPSWPSDRYLYPYLHKLLVAIASQPTKTHYYDSINGSNLKDVLQNINTNICNNQLNGTINNTTTTIQQ